ncbi:ABC-type transport system, ATPase component [Methanocella arvoryzae MRE50]|uniref:ABC-type transport system, ATPase component n=2 Tax=Methanocella TaxID=570266 RepID=Q0W3V3_METAR|nr:ABC-type transport system, ATPase component [Methanocella arvoryzae MRE50]
MTVMIKTESLTKVYDGVKAVDSVSLSVGGGEVFGFLGPNGAGKTTTIGMMVGLIEPSGGKCWIDDIDVTRKPLEAKRITGYLPDGVGFYANLSARQNLKYFSRFYGMTDTASDARITELLRRVGLDKVEKPVGGYSRGMKQRLGLAQALLNDPKYVFLDEPTNGLDPEGVIQFRNIIKEMAAEGRTVFFSSHVLNEVQQVCNTIGIISKGRIVAQGTPDEVRRMMRKDEHVTIKIKVIGTMPKLSDSRIVSADYVDGSAIITATEDIRDDISEQLYTSGIRIRELRLEEQTLEEVFLNTIYRGEKHEV